MEVESTDDQYFTFEGRLASFQKTKKRGSTARGARALNWPHEKIDPEQLARAGFYFQPWPENPDNVTCYLCHKAMDGWEEGDDPLIEHLKHSASCGWAICAAVESEVEGYANVHPAEKEMAEARKATFAGRWPHDAKRGWKCKTKQLVDAGWKYTPTPEANDNTTCTYCGLGLDGWEQNDKPYDEHYSRSPSCPFFALSALPRPKASRAKAARGSKVSRLSTQSVATFTSEAPSIADTTLATAAGNDTILSTTSTMATKKARASKAATSTRGKKTRAKKGEPTPEPEEHVYSEVVPLEGDRQVTPEAPLPQKATRGNKRPSDAVEESTLTVTSEAPARKKRATKRAGSVAVEGSVVESIEDSQMTDAPAPALKKKPAAKQGRASAAKPRKVSQSKAQKMAEPPTQDVPGMFPDDDEIERQLEADLERPLSDDDDVAADSDSERRKVKAKAGKDVAAGLNKSANYAMFDPMPPAEPEDEEVDAELEALRHEMEVEPTESRMAAPSQPDLDREPILQEEPAQLTVPKKGRKAGTRKASKQTKTKKTKVIATPPVEEPEPGPELQPEVEPELELQDVDIHAGRYESIGSTDTVVKNPEAGLDRFSDAQPSFHSVASRVSFQTEEPAEEPVLKKKPRGRPSKASLASQKSVEFADLPMEDPLPVTQAPVKAKKASKKAAPAPSPVLQAEKVEIEPASEAPQAAKRPRGRPSKASLGPQALTESVEPADDSVVVVEAMQKPAEKGRGRPSKVSTEATVEAVDTDAHTVEPAASSEPPAAAKRGRGRPSKAAQEASAVASSQSQAAEQPPKRGRGRPPKKSSIESKSEEAEAQLQQEAMDAEARHALEPQSDELQILEDERDLSPIQEAVAIPSSPPSRQAAHPPSTPGHSATSARQAGISPSQSPQSSDAENQPPSSRPSASVTTKRIALAPVAETPTRLSPSKRNMLSNLQSKTPWQAVDLDAVLESPLKGATRADENTVDRLLRKGGELTAKEKSMTVEEWVYHNARLAEDMLRGECERMVNRFESEGGRAMTVLEGIEVD